VVHHDLKAENFAIELRAPSRIVGSKVGHHATIADTLSMTHVERRDRAF
jgi:hypothetical protein